MQWSVLNNRLAGARSELSAELNKLEKLENELASLPKAEGNAAYQDEIIRLGKLAREVPVWREQLQHDMRDLTELENELSDALRKLGWSRQDTRWRTLRLDLSQQAEVNEVTQSLDKLARQLNDCRTRIDVAEKQLHMHRAPGSREAQPQLDLTWDRIVEIESQLRAMRPAAHQFDHLSRQLEQARGDRRAQLQADELLRMTRELAADATLELASDWPVPELSELNQRLQAITTARSELARLTADQTRYEKQIAESEQAIASLKASTGIKSLAELEAMWCQRDEIVAHWREELRTPLLASSVTPTEYEERLADLKKFHEQSDNAVRAMLADMTRSAELASREREVVQLKSICETCAQQLGAAQSGWTLHTRRGTSCGPAIR